MDIKINVDEIAEDVACKIIGEMMDLHDVVSYALIEELEEENATHSDLAYAMYVINRYNEFLCDVVSDHFNVELEEELISEDCDGDCENCIFNEE